MKKYVKHISKIERIQTLGIVEYRVELLNTINDLRSISKLYAIKQFKYKRNFERW